MQRNPLLIVGAISFAGGCAWVALDSISWYYAQQYLGAFDEQTALNLVMRYYLGEALAIGIAIGGAYVLYKGLLRLGRFPCDSIGAILADALSTRRNVRIGIVAGVLYGAVYLFASSIVIYQPSVNFQATYGATSPGLAAAVCCGSPGTVPELIVYVSPQAHLALQVLPLDALFAVVIPLLVGLNVAVAAHAVWNGAVKSNAGWLGSIGIMTGLFTGCPTCAGFFLAGAAGGLGATALYVALAPYQMLFVVLCVPVLLASPVVIALYAGRATRVACAVPNNLTPEMLKKS